MSEHERKEAPSALPTLTRLANAATGMAVLGAVGLAAGYFSDPSAAQGHKVFAGAYHYGFIFWQGAEVETMQKALSRCVRALLLPCCAPYRLSAC